MPPTPGRLGFRWSMCWVWAWRWMAHGDGVVGWLTPESPESLPVCTRGWGQAREGVEGGVWTWPALPVSPHRRLSHEGNPLSRPLSRSPTHQAGAGDRRPAHTGQAWEGAMRKDVVVVVHVHVPPARPRPPQLSLAAGCRLAGGGHIVDKHWREMGEVGVGVGEGADSVWV